MTEYLDFEVEIGIGTGREYPIAVIRSPGGEAREQMVFPFDELALDSQLKDLQIALLRSGGQHRLVPTPQEQTIQDFGQKLFTALMTGDVRARFDVSTREAVRQGKGLRIKLRIQAPELACLPWEFMYDPHEGEYVCLSTQTPMVRYIELTHTIEPLTVVPPLRILGLIAGPCGLALLDVENEKRRMEKALRNLLARDQVSITWQEHVTWYDLQHLMRIGQWNIVHFIGHGGFDRLTDEGLIALEDEDGNPHLLPASQLARLLAGHISLRLVLLNVCEGGQGSNKDIFSSTASILVRHGIPAVLAMQYAITDRAAVEFGRGFYDAIADGLPVDAAVTEARKAISIGVTNTLEWGTPILFMRTPDGVLFRSKTPTKKDFDSQIEEQKREQARRESEALQIQLATEKVAQEAAEKAAREQAEKEAQLRADEKAELERIEQEAQRLAAKKAAEEIAERERLKREAAERRRRMFRLAGIITLVIIGLIAMGYLVPNVISLVTRHTATATYTLTLPPTITLTLRPTYTPIPTLGPGSAMTNPADKMILFYVPEGEFSMGANASDALAICQKYTSDCDQIAFSDGEPSHTVYLNAFWIDQTEVSNAMYALCVQAGKCASNGDGSDSSPVVNVTWIDASNYCTWAGRRLPTEAEWEKAARGTDGRTFPWGSSSPSCSLANLAGCAGHAVTVDANQAGASPYGALNMVGNVWEWVADWFKAKYDTGSSQSNPKGPGSGSYRAMRGGSWMNTEGYIIPTVRGYYKPDKKLNTIGFRCVADP